ncbi:MAG: hypothetical protein U1A78_37955 [Polyangia bacterium]
MSEISLARGRNVRREIRPDPNALQTEASEPASSAGARERRLIQPGLPTQADAASQGSAAAVVRDRNPRWRATVAWWGWGAISGAVLLATAVWLSKQSTTEKRADLAVLRAVDQRATAVALPPGVLRLATAPGTAEPTVLGVALSTDGYLVTALAGIGSRCPGEEGPASIFVSEPSQALNAGAHCVLADRQLAVLRLMAGKAVATDIHTLPADAAGTPVHFIADPSGQSGSGRLVAAGAGPSMVLDVEPATSRPLPGSPVLTLTGQVVGIVSSGEPASPHFQVATLAELLRLLGAVQRGKPQVPSDTTAGDRHMDSN